MTGDVRPPRAPLPAAPDVVEGGTDSIACFHLRQVISVRGLRWLAGWIGEGDVDQPARSGARALDDRISDCRCPADFLSRACFIRLLQLCVVFFSLGARRSFGLPVESCDSDKRTSSASWIS